MIKFSDNKVTKKKPYIKVSEHSFNKGKKNDTEQTYLTKLLHFSFLNIIIFYKQRIVIDKSYNSFTTFVTETNIDLLYT